MIFSSNIKIIFGFTSLIVGLFVFIPYYIGIVKGKIKPHVLSWTTWGLILGVGFILSYFKGGGGGAWIFGLQSILCFGIAIWALCLKNKIITRLDWVSFTGAIVVTIFYIFTKNAVLTAIFAATIDSLGFVPTFRKSYLLPYDEPIITYALSGLSFFISIFALETYEFSVLFYPLVLVLMNGIFVLFLIMRRQAIKSNMI